MFHRLVLIPEVAQAYATNLTEATGEVVGAAVVTREAYTLADLDRAARARLSAFKVPKRWVLLGSPADVPALATGKIDKPGLQDLIRKHVWPPESRRDYSRTGRQNGTASPSSHSTA